MGTYHPIYAQHEIVFTYGVAAALGWVAIAVLLLVLVAIRDDRE